MMEPGLGKSTGMDAEPVIPSGTDTEEVSGEAGRKDTPPEPEDPVRRRTSGRQRRASLEEYRETYLTVPKIRNRKTVFVSEDVRDELDAVVRRLGGRGMSVSGLLENLAREHLAFSAASFVFSTRRSPSSVSSSNPAVSIITQGPSGLISIGL